LSLYRVRAILSNHNVCFYHIYLVRKGASMPTQSLPAPSLRTAICFPAGMPTWAGNPLIYRTLCAILVVGSIFLPALREARGSSVGLATTTTSKGRGSSRSATTAPAITRCSAADRSRTENSPLRVMTIWRSRVRVAGLWPGVADLLGSASRVRSGNSRPAPNPRS
jgi:hypothetical protein